ncbi:MULTISPECIES: B12-binding domain-containing radical SAM protein [Geobacter]|uniref:B12-binding domain-containing radical SAM protein n=1 Tax=Geobacter TaxID=28231 RepID=UPI002572CFF4|nr:radical SAM protein [Geobacter sulfurreducens]BEH11128.1 B12-binding domain-containing radical SAM protein [Geobacter sulfurreducens subsp. ethanolicus]BET58977.1 B12-binding domain-containing radical SAM protein [Geobacter sp. 60473]HML79187.1 radical SAM protein [Geobacter sulfurreducens]
MRVLLAYKSHQAGARDPFASLLPTGLGYLNGLLRAQGFASRIANLSTAGWREVDVLLRREQPAIFGISQYTHNRFESLKLASIAKTIDPTCLTVLGGPHATHSFDMLLQHHPQVDAVVLGEGEETMLELVRAVAQGDRSLAGIPGLAIRKGSGISHSTRAPLRNLDDLPVPAHYFDNALGCDLRRQLEFVITSRGCPASCRFCSSPRFWGTSLRLRSPRAMVDEIRYLRDRFGLLSFSLRDDTFTARADRVIEFCRLLSAEGLHILWSCQSRVNCVDEEMLLWMRRAGCEYVQYGVESGSDRILARLGKRITPDQVRRAAAATRRAGMDLSIYLITGVPGEDEEDLRATLRLIEDIRPHDGHVAPLAYYPGTALFAEAVREGRVPADFFEREKGEACFVRKDAAVQRSMDRLLTTLERVGRRSRFGPTDFARQAKIVGWCHAGALAEGGWYEEREEWREAEARYRQVTHRQPANPLGWLALGGLHGSVGDLERSRQMFTRVLDLVPAHIPAHLALGDLCLHAGDRRGARRNYEAALTLNPGDVEARERLKELEE